VVVAKDRAKAEVVSAGVAAVVEVPEAVVAEVALITIIAAQDQTETTNPMATWLLT